MKGLQHTGVLIVLVVQAKLIPFFARTIMSSSSTLSKLDRCFQITVVVSRIKSSSQQTDPDLFVCGRCMLLYVIQPVKSTLQNLPPTLSL